MTVADVNLWQYPCDQMRVYLAFRNLSSSFASKTARRTDGPGRRRCSSRAAALEGRPRRRHAVHKAGVGEADAAGYPAASGAVGLTGGSPSGSPTVMPAGRRVRPQQVARRHSHEGRPPQQCSPAIGRIALRPTDVNSPSIRQSSTTAPRTPVMARPLLRTDPLRRGPRHACPAAT